MGKTFYESFCEEIVKPAFEIETKLLNEPIQKTHIKFDVILENLRHWYKLNGGTSLGWTKLVLSKD